MLLLGALVTFAVSIANLRSDVDNGRIRIADLEQRLLATNNRYSDLTNQVTAIQRDLKEIETQFCAADDVRNLSHATDLRIFAMLWEKVYMSHFPTDNAFYPKIGRC